MIAVVLPGAHGLTGANTTGLHVARHLAARGDRIVFLQYEKFSGGPFGLIDEWRRLGDVIPVRGRHVPRLAQAAARMPAPDLFFAMTADTFAHAIEMQRRFFPRAKVVVGVYHPQQFSKGGYTEFHRRRFRRIFERFPDENVVFMDTFTKQSTARMFGRTFDASHVVPLPVAARDVDPAARRWEPCSVVCVGRLVDFKYVHVPVMSVLRKLRDRGIPMTYTVHGDGPLHERLLADIRAFDAESWASAPGLLPYERFAEVVSRAWAFVGCGAALIEAAMLGVPSLVQSSVVHPESYGWFHRVRDHNIGENDLEDYDFAALQRRSELVPMLDSFEELLASTPDEYRRISEATQACAREKFGADVVLERYVRAFESAVPYTYEGPGLVDALLVPAGVCERVYDRLTRNPLEKHG